MTISFIIPCYNEEENLNKGVLDRIERYTKDNKSITEVIIVDDGSIDRSKEIIKSKYLKTFPKLRLIENNHGGKALAVITGIKNATGNYVIFLDMDLATPLNETEKMMSKFESGSVVVIGSRNRNREGAPFLRKIQASGFMFIRSVLINLSGITDTQCGFKGFKRDIALKIFDKFKVFVPSRKVNGPSVSAGFDLEFLFLARKLGYKIDQISVVWHHVETHRVNFIKDSLEGLFDIIKIKTNDLAGKYA